MKAIRMLLLVTALGLVPACASTGTSAASKREATTVVVDNRALLDMTIYVIRGGQQLRLGIANGLSKTRLTLPSGIVTGATTIRFRADPIGSSRAPVSEEINVSEGEEIELMIPPNA